MKSKNTFIFGIILVLVQFVVSKAQAADAPRFIFQKNIMLQGMAVQIQFTEQKFVQELDFNNHAYEQQGSILELHKIFKSGTNGSDVVIWRKFIVDIPGPPISWSADVMAYSTNELFLGFSKGSGFVLHRIGVNAIAETVPDKLSITNMALEGVRPETNSFAALPSQYLQDMPTIKSVILTQNGEDVVASLQTVEKKQKKYRFSPATKSWNAE
jgi:hypothetical protein